MMMMMNRDRQGAGCALKTRLLTRAVHRATLTDRHATLIVQH